MPIPKCFAPTARNKIEWALFTKWVITYISNTDKNRVKLTQIIRLSLILFVVVTNLVLSLPIGHGLKNKNSDFF